MSITIDDEDRELVEVAYRNAQRLSMLIDDLMMLDQCEIGAPTMHVEPTPLIPLVERVVSTFAAAAEDSGVQLGRTYDQAAQPALVALADPARLEQALTNLVGNAIKFTPSGGSVTVGVGIGDANQVQVTVTDTGMGIEAGDCSRIFERFYRSRGVADSAIPGSGLGLAIARVMVEAQAGSIAVTSQPGMGSTFSITLPAVAEHRLSSVPLTAVSAREQIVEDGPTSNIILVADDEPDIVALVSRRLTRSGFAVITAVNGEDALQMTRDQMPDLALLDVMMPKLTGIEVSRLLRTAPETHATPVILMSAGLFDKLTIPAVADAFIAKPFGEVELTDLVREVLGVHAGAGGRTLSSGAWGNSQP